MRTARLALRPLHPAHLDALIAIWSDPRVAEVLYARGLPPRERVERWIGGNVADPPRVFLLEREGAPIGYAGVQPLAETGEPELFYALQGDAWGRGYATEACSAVVGHARAALGLPGLVAVVLPTNARSVAVVRRLGFREVGTMEHAGATHLRFELDLTAS